jgi:NAD(P)-dependent dehydrogenase (short-subunit alcohol dehydrogenase family)
MLMRWELIDAAVQFCLSWVEQHRGVIINISSTPAISGYIKGAPYTVAKAANLGITKHIAAE